MRNEGIEVDDFQYGRDGHKNRPSGRYPLRLWGRTCDHEASAAPREGNSARSDATMSGKSGSTEASTGGNALGKGQPKSPLMPERPSVSHMKVDSILFCASLTYPSSLMPLASSIIVTATRQERPPSPSIPRPLKILAPRKWLAA